jgi:hypothetical protein
LVGGELKGGLERQLERQLVGRFVKLQFKL